MQVRVLFFGSLRDAGMAGAEVTLPEGATAAELLDLLAAEHPVLCGMRDSLALAINQEYASRDSLLREGDEVALLPPVSGGADGSHAAGAGTIQVRLQREPIERDALLEAVAAPADGAVLTFEGVVRDNSRGRRTLCLDYEAYEPMALREMEKLAAEAMARFAIRSVAIVHRIGRLQIGEVSVCIVVAAAHRGAAYDASRFLIDTLKRTVPVWKREHFEDGAVWVDGEPFPPEILGGKNLPSGSSSSK
jgi:molybdopterin converting factor subunit 1